MKKVDTSPIEQREIDDCEAYRKLADYFDHLSYTFHNLSKFIHENFPREVKKNDTGTESD